MHARFDASNPNIKAAMRLLQRSAYVMEREKAGSPMTRRQATRYLGCPPEEVLNRLDALTAHIEIVGRDGETLFPARTVN